MGRDRKNVIDLTGQKFGRWTVIKRVEIERRCNSRWLCRCDCGTERIVRSNSLRGGSFSCGCFQKEKATELGRLKATHGMSGTRIYSLWKSIRQRCHNENYHQYKDYGGRGIKVCDRWQIFENFLEDLGNVIPEEMTLDRIDVNGDYCPENCRWANMITQCNNTRRNHSITFNGQTLTLIQWSRKLGINYFTLFERFNQNWTVEEAFSIPVSTSNRLKTIRKRNAGLVC